MVKVVWFPAEIVSGGTVVRRSLLNPPSIVRVVASLVLPAVVSVLLLDQVLNKAVTAMYVGSTADESILTDPVALACFDDERKEVGCSV